MTGPRSVGEPPDTGAFDLGALRIDPTAGELRGPTGHEQLDPKVMDVLRVLHEQRGVLVPREALFARVWPDRVVTDDVLSRCIYHLRRQLRAAGGDAYAELIETLPKRGYRLRAPEEAALATPETAATAPSPGAVRTSAVAPAATDGPVASVAAAARADTPRPPPSPFTPRAVAFLGIGAFVAIAGYLVAAAWTRTARDAATPEPRLAPAAPPVPANSIAVLPFVDLSEARDHDYLAEGLADELLSTLAERSSLAVTARTSSFAFREQGTDLVEVGRRLGVAYVVEGSVRASGGRLRITTDLVDARTGRRVWSRSHDRDFGDVLTLQDEIAESVAASLEATLAARGPALQSGVADANDAYLRSRFLYNRRAPGDIEKAERNLKRAVELDPAHGLAWALLAGVYTVEPERDPSLALQREAIERALAAAPDLAETHVRAANYHFAAGDPERALHHRARAMKIDPDNLLLLSTRAGIEYWRGAHEEAVATQRRVVERDPLSAIAHHNLVVYLMAAEDYAGARSAYATFLELSPEAAQPDGFIPVQLSILEGRIDQAWQAAQALPAGVERDAVVAMLASARGQARLGEDALARLADPAATKPLGLVRAAEVHAYHGDPEKAWVMLERAYAAGADPRLRDDPSWQVEARGSPFLARVRSDPRWLAFRQRLDALN